MVIEKEWGSVTGEVHRERVLPWVYRFMDWVAQHPENLTQQLHDLNGLWDRATKGIVRLVNLFMSAFVLAPIFAHEEGNKKWIRTNLDVPEVHLRSALTAEVYLTLSTTTYVHTPDSASLSNLSEYVTTSNGVEGLRPCMTLRLPAF